MGNTSENRHGEIRAAIAAGLNDIDDDRSALDLIEEIPLLEAAVDEIVADRVAAARDLGLSWEAIAQRLGISRQAAHKRFGTRSKSRKSRVASKGGTRIEVRMERARRQR